jgi:NTP pyrophosphatase (non-canonical NTP hydrolase)
MSWAATPPRGSRRRLDGSTTIGVTREDRVRNFDELLDRVVRFRDDRDWKQFHHPKDLAISIALEAAELLEHFQWKTREEIARDVEDPDRRRELGEEMADVLILLLSASDAVGVDLYEATVKKIEKNAHKYPVEKARGNAKKYDRLGE